MIFSILQGKMCTLKKSDVYQRFCTLPSTPGRHQAHDLSRPVLAFATLMAEFTKIVICQATA